MVSDALPSLVSRFVAIWSPGCSLLLTDRLPLPPSHRQTFSSDDHFSWKHLALLVCITHNMSVSPFGVTDHCKNTIAQTQYLEFPFGGRLSLV